MIYTPFRGIIRDQAFSYQVLSYNLVSKTKFAQPFILISVCDPGVTPPQVESSYLLERLDLRFHDTDLGGPHNIEITEEQAKQITDLVAKYSWQNVLLVVHCMAGLSRSSAIAAACSEIHDERDDFFFHPPNGFIPNKKVYRAVLNAGRQAVDYNELFGQ